MWYSSVDCRSVDSRFTLSFRTLALTAPERVPDGTKMATAEEWISATDRPAQPASASGPDDIDDNSPTLPLVVLPHASAKGSPPHLLAATVLDLGDKDCSDGPLEEVASALRRMPVDSGLEVRTTHGDVAVALLVWCRLAGHNIVEQTTGRFLIVPTTTR